MIKYTRIPSNDYCSINAIAKEAGLTHRAIHIRIVLERISVIRFGERYLVAKDAAERLIKELA
jgi:hypothetical protein